MFNCIQRRLTLSTAAALIGVPLFVGCAAVPDVAVSYRPVRWSLIVTVAHTITCNRDNTLAVVERGATFLPIYSAAAADGRFQIRLKDLDRFFADSDIALALTDDGRLKSINQSTVGQGETVVKSAIAAVAALSATPAVPAAVQSAEGVSLFTHNIFEKRAEARSSDVCNVVRRWSLVAPDQLPQVSLIQTASIKKDALAVQAAPRKDQQRLLQELKEARLDLSTTVTATLAADELQPISDFKTAVTSNEVALTLQRMVALSATATDGEGAIGSKAAPVPIDAVFVLPIPKAALFGKQSFSLVLAESGRISNIGYGRSTGVPGALGAATAIAGAEVTEDNADAAALKSAADLIAQQQRYNNCKLKPGECK